MNIIDMAKSTIRNITQGRNDRKNFFLTSWDYGRELLNEHDLSSQINAYKSWVYVFANRNAMTVSQIPLRMYVAKKSNSGKLLVQTRSIERSTKEYLYNNAGLDKYLRKASTIEEVLEHPLLDLFNNVNPFRNRGDLFSLTELYLNLTGNCYWYLVYNQLGLPVEIWIVPSDRMKVIPDKEKFIQGYVYYNGEDKIFFNQEEIIHFLILDPRNLYYGISPLSALAGTYNLSANLEEFQKNLVKNGAIPSGILKTEQKLTQAQFDILKEQWQTKYSGVKNAGKTPVLDSGLEYQPITISPKDLSVIALDENAKEKLCNAFGQSLGLWSENATEANARVAYVSYLRDTIRPKLRSYEEKINEKICPLYDENIFVAYDNPVPEDRDYQLKKRESDLKYFVISPNEARQQDGLEPVDWGDAPLVPMSYIPLKGYAGQNRLKKTIIKQADKERHWNNFIKKVTPYEKIFANITRQLFREQEERVMKALRKKTVKGIDDIFDVPKSEEELKRWAEKFLPTITEIVKYNGQNIMYELGLDIGFDVSNPRVVEWIRQHSGTAIKEIQETTLQKLRDTIAEGIENGESIPKLSQRIASVYDEAQGYRTDRIARTETISGSNQGALEAYRQSNIVDKKAWVTAIDERTCEECMALDGEEVDINQPFSCGLDRPPLHPNCRCTIMAVLK